MNKISILVVEDNPTDSALVRAYLCDMPGWNYELESVENLNEALTILCKQDFDIVLLDLSLPDSSGIETVRTMIGKHPRVAIVVLTGVQDEQLALQAVRYGAQDYLDKKQLSPVVLRRSIAYALERKKNTREKENLFADLAKALERIEILQGMLPVCPCCNKIQDEKSNWRLFDEYLESPGKSDPRHNLCPDCLSHLHVGGATS